jgi:hypothetical protein
MCLYSPPHFLTMKRLSPPHPSSIMRTTWTSTLDEFQAEELLSFDAQLPSQEQAAIHRREVMRQARSKKQRPILFAELEQRYLDAP